MAAERLTVTLALSVPLETQTEARDAVQAAIEKALLPMSENRSAVYLLGGSYRLGEEAGPVSTRYNATVEAPTANSAVVPLPAGTSSSPDSSSA